MTKLQNTYAPIILFVYNRPDHLLLTLDALYSNELAKQSDLYVYCDAPKRIEHEAGVMEVKKIVRAISGFKSVNITYREKNMGIAVSIVNGVSEILTKNESCIIVEDDIVVSPQFLRFMNDSLAYFKDDMRISTISGYTYPHKILKFPKNYEKDIFFNMRIMPWGWATWANRWTDIRWDSEYYQIIRTDVALRSEFNKMHPSMSTWLINKLNTRSDTWSIQMSFYYMQKNMYSVYPTHSFTNNIGNDKSGSTKQYKPYFIHKKLNQNLNTVFHNFEINPAIDKAFRKAGSYSSKNSAFSFHKDLYAYYATQRDKNGLFSKFVIVLKKIDRKQHLFNVLKRSALFIFKKINLIDKSTSKKPFMTDEEIHFFEKNLRNNNKVFEWGSGYGTLYFSKKTKKYVSIEHDKKWFNKINEEVNIVNTSSPLIELVFVPAEPSYNHITYTWNPEFEGTNQTFKEYIQIFDTYSYPFDVFLIDGRARVECAKKILPRITENAKVFIHDFQRYEELREWYFVIEQVGTLALLKKK